LIRQRIAADQALIGEREAATKFIWAAYRLHRQDGNPISLDKRTE
jgi:hypothetical protein